jgi:hypothetical protein
MKKQTAVEWLMEQINQDYPEMTWAYKDECDQAKEMEKEQIIDAFIGFDSDTDENIEIAQAYYKEFYGS